MAAPLLSLRGVALGFGGDPLFQAVDMQIGQGDRICVVGRNGSGKSTLLKIVAGLLESDAGERAVQPGVRVAYLAQEAEFAGAATIAEAAAAGLPASDADATYRVDSVLQHLDLDGDALVDTLSGGEARRVALARAFVAQPDILLLDEPTNHLDLPTIQWLEETLEQFAGALVMISHDRAFLNRLTRTTFWLEAGALRRLDKGFPAFDGWSAQVLAHEAEAHAKLKSRIAEETHWLHRGVTARRRRNEGRLRRLHAMRAEWQRRTPARHDLKLQAESGVLSGRLVIEARDIDKAYGARRIVNGFSTRVLRGDRVGIIGANGVGKTTLLQMLVGVLPPDAGAVRLGTKLTVAYLDQMRAQLDGNATVWDTLCERGGDHVIVHGQSRHVVAYLRDFLFEERQAHSPVSSLSGGERNRLLLAKTLAQPANLLVLDEPTNDLDMETLDLLQEMLADYDGTLLLVSHDRDFLDRVVTSTIVMEGDGRALEYPGGYSDYIRQRPPPSTPRPVTRPAAKVSPQPAKPASRPRLSYKQQRQLEQLPGRIADLQGEIAALETQLADPAFFSRDPDGFAVAARSLDDRQTALAEAEETWLEIELLREEIEAARS